MLWGEVVGNKLAFYVRERRVTDTKEASQEHDANFQGFNGFQGLVQLICVFSERTQVKSSSRSPY